MFRSKSKIWIQPEISLKIRQRHENNEISSKIIRRQKTTIFTSSTCVSCSMGWQVKRRNCTGEDATMWEKNNVKIGKKNYVTKQCENFSLKSITHLTLRTVNAQIFKCWRIQIKKLNVNSLQLGCNALWSIIIGHVCKKHLNISSIGCRPKEFLCQISGNFRTQCSRMLIQRWNRLHLTNLFSIIFSRKFLNPMFVIWFMT